MIYEDLIPADHLLRKLAVAVDLSLVAQLVSDCYCPDNGRPSGAPLVLFKVVFLLFDKLRVVSNVEPQFLYDLSDREIEEQVNLHLACFGCLSLHRILPVPRRRARRIPTPVSGAKAKPKASTVTRSIWLLTLIVS